MSRTRRSAGRGCIPARYGVLSATEAPVIGDQGDILHDPFCNDDPFQGLQEGQQKEDPVLRALKFSQYGAIGPVLHPAGEAQLRGQLSACKPEAHALDPAGKGDAPPDRPVGRKIRDLRLPDLIGDVWIPEFFEKSFKHKNPFFTTA